MEPDDPPGRSRVHACIPLALGLMAGLAGAQMPPLAEVSGFVVEEGDGAPAWGALVAIRNGPDTDADGDGRFHLGQLRPGRHEIVAVGRGCRVVRGSFTVEPGRAKQLKLVLPPASRIAADRRSDGSGTVIDARQLGQSRAPDLLEAIRDRVPLLNADRAGGGGSFRGGGDAGGVGVIVDGVRVSGSLERLRSIRIQDVARVEIHRSATAGMAYGPDLSGGLVIVTTWSVIPGSDTPPESCGLPWDGGR